MSKLSIGLDGGGKQSRPGASLPWRISGCLRKASTRPAMIALIALSVLRACGGPQEGAGAGSECFRDADCNEGLICVERVCSNDVDALVSTVEGPSGEAAAVTGGVTSGTGAVETSSASSSTTMGSASTTGSTTGAGGTGATTTQGAAGAAGSP